MGARHEWGGVEWGGEGGDRGVYGCYGGWVFDVSFSVSISKREQIERCVDDLVIWGMKVQGIHAAVCVADAE